VAAPCDQPAAGAAQPPGLLLLDVRLLDVCCLVVVLHALLLWLLSWWLVQL
jgi:hypothetical protein